ncbi:DUF309 domain-containing protein [Desulfobacula sp.]|uniref:DUF309 domain-containing protein n=1 Tax=Desulfobacula sp. TaxID=2593537 RepID=UPI002613FA20|nr:DUF309 domain-containing protein [Desulfobacula sp.]
MLGNTGMIFDPFENRTCRDIRNNLGHDFVKAIQTKDPGPFKKNIASYPSRQPNGPVATYIRHRTDCFETIFDQIISHGNQPDGDIIISILLWNLELFFEFHEWLETEWLSAHGAWKNALQALILSAIVYELLTYGRRLPAEKVAAKALLLFKQHKGIIPDLFDTNLLILKLTELDPVPPKFNIKQHYF